MPLMIYDDLTKNYKRPNKKKLLAWYKRVEGLKDAISEAERKRASLCEPLR